MDTCDRWKIQNSLRYVQIPKFDFFFKKWKQIIKLISNVIDKFILNGERCVTGILLDNLEKKLLCKMTAFAIFNMVDFFRFLFFRDKLEKLMWKI